VKPAPEDGWFVVFTFAAKADARRVLWDPDFKPTQKPAPEEKKGKETDKDPGSK